MRWEERPLHEVVSLDSHQHYGPSTELLDRFINPMFVSGSNPLGKWRSSITVRAPEFTTLCPKTGQPDFATIHLEYEPNAWCLESKSWKLYLGSYRQYKGFHEACVQRMASDLIKLLDPLRLHIRGEFTPRGGIPFWPEITYER